MAGNSSALEETRRQPFRPHISTVSDSRIDTIAHIVLWYVLRGMQITSSSAATLFHHSSTCFILLTNILSRIKLSLQVYSEAQA